MMKKGAKVWCFIAILVFLFAIPSLCFVVMAGGVGVDGCLFGDQNIGKLEDLHSNSYQPKGANNKIITSLSTFEKGDKILNSKGDKGMILESYGINWWFIRWEKESSEGRWSEENQLRKNDFNPSTKFSSPNQVVEVCGTNGLGLDVRTEPPDLAWEDVISEGAKGTIIGGPFYGIPKDHVSENEKILYHFWKVKFRTITGWCAEGYPGGVAYLKKVESPGIKSTKFKTGDFVRVIADPGRNIRTKPKLGDEYIKIPPSPLQKGSEGQVIEHQDNGVSNDGHYWWYLRFGDYEGWCAGDGLEKSEAAPHVAKPVLTSPLKITRKEVTPSFCSNTVGGPCFSDIPTLPYFVGDTLTTTFTIKNEGTNPITLSKLTVGGRFNGGKLPNGEYPDFPYIGPVTLIPDKPYKYEGTLLLPYIDNSGNLQIGYAGNYQFFCAYQTPDGDWNTNIDLSEGLTDADRVEDIEVYKLPIIDVSTSRTLEIVNLDGADQKRVYEVIRQVLDIDKAKLKLIEGENKAEDEALLNCVDSLLEILNPDSEQRSRGEVQVRDIAGELPEDTWLVLEFIKKGGAPMVGSGLIAFGLLTVQPGFIGAGIILLKLAAPISRMGEITQMLSLEIGEKVLLKDFGSATIKYPGLGRMEIVWLRSPKDKIIVNVYVGEPHEKRATMVVSVGEWRDELKMTWGENALTTDFIWNAFTYPPQNSITDPESIIDHVQIVRFHSPGELRVYDSQGRVTGLVNGEVKEKIPGSVYDNVINVVTIFSPSDSYLYEVVGTGIGTYGLDVTSIEERDATTFTATDIPTTPGAIHQYTIDWAALSQGEKGVTVKIDSNGDGVFEKRVIADNKLSQEELTPTLPVHNTNTGESFSTIQAAVDAANTGDTIIVRDGTYTENVDIDKSITLKSSSGNPEYTIVDAVESYADVFSVTADHVNISGFTVTGAPDFYGIYLYNADYCDISDNICSHNAASGIYLSGSNSNSISDNTCFNNGMGGICLSSSTKNSIANNTCSSNGFAGIDLGCSNQNSISNNLCCNNKLGIFLDATNNNRIYLNNLNNDCNVQSYDSCNIWNSKEKITYSYDGKSHTKYLGNYWSDYTGTDANKNGIGDSPYSIDDRGGDIDQDYYPLMTWSEHYTWGDFDESNKATCTNTIGMEFVRIPAGEFEMGSPSDEEGRYSKEGPVHHVTIENSFYMGKYEVTQKQWRAIKGDNPSYFTGDDNLPVESVSWDDVQEFIRKLNEKEGTDKYRLPSEAEWEYACRAGTTTRYSFGDDDTNLGDYVWTSDWKTHPVGQKKPNSWELYDMHGSVWEWVQDSWHSSYSGAPVDGSAWENGEGTYRVRRGGGWNRYPSRSCRSADRGCAVPGLHGYAIGFRLLKEQ